MLSSRFLRDYQVSQKGVKMKFTAHIVIERSREEVFDWMLQPRHIVQLITIDHTKSNPSYAHIPPSPELDEHIAKVRRIQGQTETVIEIEDLSTPTLLVGTTFQYRMGVSSQSEELPAWRLLSTGTVTIKKSIPPTSFTFTTQRYSSLRRHAKSAEHHLVFQAQQESTIVTYTESTGSGKIGLMIASVVAPRAVTFGNEFFRYQLMQLKTQMENGSDT